MVAYIRKGFRFPPYEQWFYSGDKDNSEHLILTCPPLIGPFLARLQYRRIFVSISAVLPLVLASMGCAIRVIFLVFFETFGQVVLLLKHDLFVSFVSIEVVTL